MQLTTARSQARHSMLTPTNQRNRHQNSEDSSQNSSSTPSPETFDSAKQNAFFKKLVKQRFSGKVHLEFEESKPWMFVLHLGRLVYGTGGNYSVSRWKRWVETYSPGVENHFSSQSLAETSDLSEVSWEYDSLLYLVQQEKISLEQAHKIIKAILTEIFFDFNQLQYKSYQLEADYSLATQLALIKPKAIIMQAWTDWQNWEGLNLDDHSPNDVPVIQKPEKLKEETADKTYKVLTKLLDGQRSIRDIALMTKRSLVKIASSLKPYLGQGIVDFTRVEDLSPPFWVESQTSESPPPASHAAAPKKQEALIACVDDSPRICKKMEKIITDAGYDFLEINDGVRALASLIRHKPDFIFLDLVMPVMNGYEVCSKLRKIPNFRETPIVILTGNDGVIDRFRAKMVGSTDFIGKPIEVNKVLAMINQYLQVEV